MVSEEHIRWFVDKVASTYRIQKALVSFYMFNCFVSPDKKELTRRHTTIIYSDYQIWPDKPDLFCPPPPPPNFFYAPKLQIMYCFTARYYVKISPHVRLYSHKIEGGGRGEENRSDKP